MLAKRTPGTPLSEAELQQRRDAARARWEGAAALVGGAAGAAAGAAGAKALIEDLSARQRQKGERAAQAEGKRAEARISRHGKAAQRQSRNAGNPWPMAPYARFSGREARLAEREVRSLRGKLPAMERKARPRTTTQLSEADAALRQQALFTREPITLPPGPAYNKARRRLKELEDLRAIEASGLNTRELLARFPSEQSLTQAIQRAETRFGAALPRQQRVRQPSRALPPKEVAPDIKARWEAANARLRDASDRKLRMSTLIGKPVKPNDPSWKIAGKDNRPPPQRATGPVQDRLWADRPQEVDGVTWQGRRTRAWPSTHDLKTMRAEMRDGLGDRVLRFRAKETRKGRERVAAALAEGARRAGRIAGLKGKAMVAGAAAGAGLGALGAYLVARKPREMEKAAPLSEAQIEQRREAAKARWRKAAAIGAGVLAAAGAVAGGLMARRTLRAQAWRQMAAKARAGREPEIAASMERIQSFSRGRLPETAVIARAGRPLTSEQRASLTRADIAVKRGASDHRILFRGVRDMDEAISLKVGDTYAPRAFLSASRSRQRAVKFAGLPNDAPPTVLVFKAPKAARMPVRGDAFLDAEKESVVPRGKWRVTRDEIRNVPRKFASGRFELPTRHIFLEMEKAAPLAKAAPRATGDLLAQRLAALFRAWGENPATAGDQESVQEAIQPAADLFLEASDSIIQPPRGDSTQRAPTGPDPRYAITGAFDARNPRVEQLLERYSFDLIRNITDQSREAVRTALQLGAMTGATIPEQARLIRQSVGLSPGQVAWVASYRTQLQNLDARALDRALRDARFDPTVRRAIETGTPLTAEQIDRMVDAYHRRTLAYRATTIARTEGIRAANMGSIAQVKAMLEADPTLTVEKTWIATKDERVRDAHARLDGQVVVGLDTPFVVQDENGQPQTIRYPHDEMAPASLTVNCRCTMGFRIIPARERRALVAEAVG